MLNKDIALVVQRAWKDQRESIRGHADLGVAHSRFAQTVSSDDPRLVPILRFAYNHLAGPELGERKVSDIGLPGANTIERLCDSLFMDDDQFASFSRFAWIMNSLSMGLGTSGLYGLHKMTGLSQKTSLAELAESGSIDIATYESPGLIETAAEFSVGYAMFIASAVRTNLSVMLYGENGSARNRHLHSTTADERASLYDARKSLLEFANADVVKIDIPGNFFEVPESFAIARALDEFKYYDSRAINADFVARLSEKDPNSLPKNIASAIGELSPSQPSSVIHELMGYRQIVKQLERPMAEMGRELLRSEGINDVADILLRAADYRNPEIAKVFEEITGDGSKGKTDRTEDIARKVVGLSRSIDDALESGEYQAIGKIIDVLGPELNELKRAVSRRYRKQTQSEPSQDIIYLTRQKKSTVWRRLLGAYLDDSDFAKLDPRNPNYDADEKELARRYRGDFERKASMWRRLLPSDLPIEVISRLTGINIHFPEFEPALAKQHVEYFMGEALAIIGELVGDRKRLYIKFGNDTERHWDDFVHVVFENPKMNSDLFLLLGSLLPNLENNGNASIPYAPFGSVLYPHFTFPGERGPLRYISYGVPIVSDRLGVTGLSDHISKVPLLSDTPKELAEKFTEIGRYDPDQVTRIVVGAVYSFMNIGNPTHLAIERHRKNVDELLLAARLLPEAYRISISAIDPRSIPEIIDARIRAEHVAKNELSDFEVYFIAEPFEFISELETSIKQKRESSRDISVRHIGDSIKGLDQNIDHAIRKAQELLSREYKSDYGQRLQQASGEDEGNVPPQIKVDILAEILLRFHGVPVAKRYLDTKRMSNFLTEIGLKKLYDPELDENFRFAQTHVSEAVRYIKTLQEKFIGITERRRVLERRVAPSRSTNMTGLNLADFLSDTLELLMKLGYRRQKLDEVQRRFGKGYAGTEEFVEELVAAAKGVRDTLDQTVDLLLFSVERSDLMYTLQGRFSEKHRKVEAIVKESLRGARRKDSADALYKKAETYPADEIYMLRRIDRKLRESEEKYIKRVQATPHISEVMLPHELQQSASVRNSIATWIRYYEQAGKYIDGSSGNVPADMAIVQTSQSAFVINPAQASSFLSHMFGYMRGEPAGQFIDSQRQRILEVRNG